MKVLLIDDDRELVDMLVFAFRRAGLETTTGHDVASGLARFDQDQPDLVVLDLHLGGSNGFDFLQRVRERSQVPIIILTALAGDDDKVKGLSLGADDYVTKPFSHRELLARILMRLRQPGQAVPRPVPDVLRVGDIELDSSAHTVQRAGQPVNLTVTEFRLLHHLLVNAGQVVRTEDILRHVWGNPDPTDSDVLRVTLHRLRRKLGETGSTKGILRTVPGVGVLLQGERVLPPDAATQDEDAAAAPPEPAPPAAEPAPPAAEPAPPAAEPAPPAAEPAPAPRIREPAFTLATAPERGGRVERDGQDRLRLRFRPDAEVESVLFVTPAATLESYDPATDEVTWTMPARGERAWDVFDVARRRRFTFADDIDLPAPSAPVAPAAPSAPLAAESADAASDPPAPAAAETPRASAVAALARAGAGRAAEGLGRAASAAASAGAAAGARARASRSRPAEAAPAPAAQPTQPAPALARPTLLGAPKAATPQQPVATAKRPGLSDRLNEVGTRMSASGRTAAMLIAVSMLAAALNIWAETGRLGLLSELERVGEISAAAYQQSERRQLFLAFTLLALYVASAVAFLVWLNRSYARLAARRIAGLRYSPASAVIWFFVPLAFLFVPRRIVAELWHASPLSEDGRHERRRSVPMLVSVWWTAFLAFAVSAVLTGATSPDPTLTDLLRQTWTNIASDLLAITAGAFAIAVIVSIETRRSAGADRPAA